MAPLPQKHRFIYYFGQFLRWFLLSLIKDLVLLCTKFTFMTVYFITNKDKRILELDITEFILSVFRKILFDYIDFKKP